MERPLTPRGLIEAIAFGDDAAVRRMLAAAPELARTAVADGATRAEAAANFLPRVGYVYEGATALHAAAAAHRADLVGQLADLGGDVNTKDRRGSAPLHGAASGNPDARGWSPAAQAQAIAELVALGAEVDVLDKNGTSPLHKAIRTRCAAAVGALLEAGADATRRTRNGTDPMTLARLTTGRGGSGSPAAKAEQAAIIELLERRAATA